MVATNSLNINGNGIVSYNNSTGVFTENAVTQYNVLVGGATNLITSITPSTTGLVLTSNGVGANPTFQTVPFTGITWVYSTITSSVNLASNFGFVAANSSSTITYTLPSIGAALGDFFEIICNSPAQATTPWIIAQNAGQQIFFGNQSTTIGVSGSVSSTERFDSVRCICVTAGGSGNNWCIVSSVGNLILA